MRPKTFTLLAVIAVATVVAADARSQVVATVGDAEITQQQLDFFARSRTGEPATDENRQQFIDQLSDLFLLSNLALKNNAQNKPDVAAQLELQRRSVLAQAAVESYLENNPVSDAELRETYDAEIGKVQMPEQFKARHILLETEEAAKEVIAALESGADFAELAKEKSTGPSGPQGGDLGWFDGNTMVPEFTAGLIQLENGAYSKTPVQTQFGWHVILREQTRTAPPPAFEDVKDQIRQSLEQRKFQQYFETLRAANQAEK